jgi:ribosome silencing factor RsfS/YbeB/iojap
LATSEQRARPRKAATSKAAKAPATRKPVAVAKKATAKKQAVPAKKAAPPKQASTPRTSKSAPSKAVAAPPRARTKPKVARSPDVAQRLRSLVFGALDDLKAKDIQEIDVRGKSNVTDLLVVVSGTSSRHVKSIADEVVKQTKRAGLPPIGVEGHRVGEWVLVDLGDIVVHVMLPRTREFYALERLWTVGDDMPATLAG